MVPRSAACRSRSRSPAGRYSALAGAGEPRYGHRTRCNVILEPGTIGVTDSVLPCGILVYVSYKDSPHILTRVIDRRPVVPGRKFDLTPKLAEELGVDGVQRFAGSSRADSSATVRRLEPVRAPGFSVEPTPIQREPSFHPRRFRAGGDVAPTWLVQVHIGLGDIGRLERNRGNRKVPPLSSSLAA